MRMFLKVVGGILVLLVLFLAFDFYRDMQTAKKVMTDFKPDLLPIKDFTALSSEEQEAYTKCVEGKLAAAANSQNENTFCRCYASGFARYLSPLLSPKPGQKLAILKDLGEAGAKNAVIIKTCSESTESGER